MGTKPKNFLVIIIFLGFLLTWFTLKNNRQLLDYVYKESEIRIIVKDGNEVSSVVVIPQGSKVRDLIKLKKLEKLNLEIHDLERELSDGDIIDFEKGF
jgi:plastocyanin domain-containing protein